MTTTLHSSVTLNDALTKFEQGVREVADLDDVSPDDVLLLAGDLCVDLLCAMDALPMRIQLIVKEARARLRTSYDTGHVVVKFSVKILLCEIERTRLGKH